ncbi:hypothetical protein AB1484_31290 [Parafrankia sp. FMc6]|uniref:hypothetical protein n=1 Tax=Parafrankia soli TaxID=2599596 RepID=UPI0034D71A1E
MFGMTPATMHLVRENLFADGWPVEGSGVRRWSGPAAADYLRAYRRRAYRTERIPVLDRSLYQIEYHYGEGSCCAVHPVIHDTSRSFVLAYDDICLGQVGFDLTQADVGPHAVVSQIQGTRYVTEHNGRVTGAEGPAKSVSWQPALLNLLVAAAPLVGASRVVVRPHTSSRYRKIQNNWFGNAHRLYDGTAQSCGFTYDSEGRAWTMATAATAGGVP